MNNKPIDHVFGGERLVVELFRTLYKAEIAMSQHQHSYVKYLDDIAEHTLWGQTYQLLRNSGSFNEVPQFFRDKITEKFQHILARNLFLKAQQERILDTLNNHSIDVIPLKGPMFAERYFGNLGGRGSSDIDLLVHREDMTKTVECLRYLGFRGPLEYNPIHFHCIMWKATGPTNEPLNVELHWGLVIERTANHDIEIAWKSAVSQSRRPHVKELSVQQTFYAICLHGANHEMDSLKYVVDVAHLVYHNGQDIDYGELANQTILDKTNKRVSMVLAIVYSIFPDLWNHKPASPFLSVKATVKTVRWKPLFYLLDDWTLRTHYIFYRLWPGREVALWYIGREGAVDSAGVFWDFYRMRIRHVVKRMTARHERERRHA